MQSQPSNQQLYDLAVGALQKLKKIENDAGWQKFSDSPCLMFRMQTQNRVMSRGQTKVNIPLAELFEKLSKEDSLAKINPQLKEIKVLYTFTLNEKQPRVNYMRYVGIWPVEDRDLVNVSLNQKADDVCYIATQACGFPYEKQSKVTRATCHIGGWILKKIDDQNSYIIYISDADLAGSIPQMIKNKLSEKQASLPAYVEKALKN